MKWIIYYVLLCPLLLIGFLLQLLGESIENICEWVGELLKL